MPTASSTSSRAGSSSNGDSALDSASSGGGAGAGGGPAPILFLHGVGGLVIYLDLIWRIVRLGAPVIVVDVRHVGMRLRWARRARFYAEPGLRACAGRRRQLGALAPAVAPALAPRPAPC